MFWQISIAWTQYQIHARCKKNAETFEKLTISIVRRHPLLENLGRSLERAAALAQLGKGPSVPFGVSQSRQSRAAERPGMVPIEFGLTWMLGHIRFRGIVLPNVIATGLRTLCGFLLVPVQKIQKRRHVLLSLFGRFRWPYSRGFRFLWGAWSREFIWRYERYGRWPGNLATEPFRPLFPDYDPLFADFGQGRIPLQQKPKKIKTRLPQSKIWPLRKLKCRNLLIFSPTWISVIILECQSQNEYIFLNTP